MNHRIPEFVEFPKIPRFSREIIITEKIDGINTQVFITEEYKIYAGSPKKWLTLKDDNYSFARWCVENEKELLKLGPGRHFGEFWGQGIRRKYAQTRKRFSLFNVFKWKDNPNLPKCCEIVPVLYQGSFDGYIVENILGELRLNGSRAVPGYRNPEGIVIYHVAGRCSFKKTLKNDEGGKEGGI